MRKEDDLVSSLIFLIVIFKDGVIVSAIESWGFFNACKEQILIQHSWNGFNKHDPRHVLLEPSWSINGPLQIILLYSSSSVFLTL